MRSIVRMVCCVAICFGAAAADIPELRIRVTEMKPTVNGVMKVQLWNDSNHEIRVPPLSAFCRPEAGMVHAEVVEGPPEPEGARSSMGCSSCGWGPARSILEQATAWTVLKSGQEITRELPLDMMLPFHGDGVYRFRLAYTRPAFKAEEWQDLKEAGIEVPLMDAESEPVSVELISGKINLLLGTP